MFTLKNPFLRALCGVAMCAWPALASGQTPADEPAPASDSKASAPATKNADWGDSWQTGGGGQAQAPSQAEVPPSVESAEENSQIPHPSGEPPRVQGEPVGYGGAGAEVETVPPNGAPPGGYGPPWQPKDGDWRGVERLPPMSYTEDTCCIRGQRRNVPVRGIPGGSMQMIWHGLQWPMYPHTGLPISGNLQVDSGFESEKRSLKSESDRQFWLQQGRFLLRATPTWSNGDYFVQAQGELLLYINQTLGNLPINVDDAWVKFGRWDKWDIQVGRYEGWEIYHKGMGFERDTLEDIGAFDSRDGTVIDIYEVNYAFYRQNGPGQAAAHYYLNKYLRFELGTVFGVDTAVNQLGARPVGIVDFGWLKFKFGGEYKKGKDWDKKVPREETSRGVGASLQFVAGTRFEGGLNAAYGVVDRIGTDGKVDEKGSPTTLSSGAFANVRPVGTLIVGGGVNYTDQDNRQFNDQIGDVGHFNHFQAFGALQHSIFTELFTAKLVVAYARAHLNESFDNDKTNSMWSARLRLRYVF